ncbi:MAG: ATP-binding protein [Chlamydiales bacterium]|nr:ATP-binding protein [Chlamydiales bacterium]
MEKIRNFFLDQISQDLDITPICALLGPRQCGKTTIARQFAKTYPEQVHYFDLEDYTDLAKLNHPKLALGSLKGLVIIDEIQRRPDLFPYLRVIVDRSNLKFLILGSASRELIKQSSETLAGRIIYINVTPFQLSEANDQNKLWTRGGFPKSYLAHSDVASVRWREAYMQTYFERDLIELGLALPPQRILRLWSMLAQYHGNVINYSNMAQFLEISVPTLKNYLALLEGTFMIRILSPWYENRGKRLVKTPKLYIRDTGILHQLLSIKNYEELILDVRKGGSWEGFALEEITKALSLRPEECYFWATHQLAELDLFINYKGRKLGFEFKCTDQPKITKSMMSAKESLSLDHLFIITPIEETFSLNEYTTVLALKECKDTIQKLALS